MSTVAPPPPGGDHFTLLPLFRVKTKTNVNIGRQYDLKIDFFLFFLEA